MKGKRFLKDNAILLFANFLGATFTMLFHFYTGRTLGPEEYGTLGAVLSIIYIFAVMIFAGQTTVAKFIAELKKKKSYTEAQGLVKKLTLNAFLIGIPSILLFFLFAGEIEYYFFIHPELTWIISPTVLLVLLLAVGKGTFQGLQEFTKLSWMHFLEGFARFGGALLLILLGLGLKGAVVAIILSYAIPAVYALYNFKGLWKKKAKARTKKLYNYGLQVTLGILGMTLLYTIDVLLVKHYMHATEAGYYTAISNLGKIIYFASFTIGIVLFPKLLEVIENRKKRLKLLGKSLILTTLISLPAVALYYLFPKLIIFLLYGKEYFSIANDIGLFGVAMTLFSLSFVLVYYHLALKKFAWVISLYLFVILEGVLLILFHKTISQVVLVITLTLLLTTITLGIGVFTKDPKALHKE